MGGVLIKTGLPIIKSAGTGVFVGVDTMGVGVIFGQGTTKDLVLCTPPLDIAKI